ncbi:hypothetical protein AVEN_122518-1 [Araneus ventricosus]|uniref:Uncharacterized protein n=1 Tax=Araneus ventricosus TaxID=182803 RepID=A0A4Y2KA21_ARAVE|nr:hypothetical protein AVEN_122518-1 [Araneus ventricosus]
MFTPRCLCLGISVIYYRAPSPCLRQRGHGQEWEGSVEKYTTQCQHSQGNRPDVLGTPDLELANQGHAMSKHSRARSHHSLHISDPHWANPTTTPLGQIKTSPSGLLKHQTPTPMGQPKFQPVRVAKYTPSSSPLYRCVI